MAFSEWEEMVLDGLIVVATRLEARGEVDLERNVLRASEHIRRLKKEIMDAERERDEFRRMYRNRDGRLEEAKERIRELEDDNERLRESECQWKESTKSGWREAHRLTKERDRIRAERDAYADPENWEADFPTVREAGPRLTYIGPTPSDSTEVGEPESVEGEVSSEWRSIISFEPLPRTWKLGTPVRITRLTTTGGEDDEE